LATQRTEGIQEEFCGYLPVRTYTPSIRVSTPSPTPTPIPAQTNWLSDPTGNQTWEYQVRDCKWVARKKGQTTEYVISDNPKYQSSVNILNGKYSDLVKDCNKPDQTQPDSQNVVTGGGQQPGQTGSSSSTGNQPASNQTQGLGTPNSIDLGLDEILKLGNPVKTNPNNTQVPVEGVPTTQQESIKVNTDVLKEEFYSTLKKLS
jgi:hypothetical protein